MVMETIIKVYKFSGIVKAEKLKRNIALAIAICWPLSLFIPNLDAPLHAKFPCSLRCVDNAQAFLSADYENKVESH